MIRPANLADAQAIAKVICDSIYACHADHHTIPPKKSQAGQRIKRLKILQTGWSTMLRLAFLIRITSWALPCYRLKANYC